MGFNTEYLNKATLIERAEGGGDLGFNTEYLNKATLIERAEVISTLISGEGGMEGEVFGFSYGTDVIDNANSEDRSDRLLLYL